MAKGRIGLDIGSTAVRAVELTGKDPYTVVHAAQVALPSAAVENGEVRDPGVVAEALRELWQRGGFKQKRVYMGVGNQRVVVREIALPYLPEKELKASLGFQVQEFIPMPVDDAVLDYDPVGEFDDQEGRKMLRLLLVAAQRGMVDQMVAAALDAKLEPVGLDLIPFAMVRAVGTPMEGMDLEEAGDEAVIDIGAHITNIVVHARGTTRFVRILPSGGRDITVAVARGLGVEDDVAERLKRGEVVEGLARAAGRRAGAAARDPARDELRGRDPLVARVLHGPGAGSAHRPRDRLRGRLEAPRLPGPPPPAHPRPDRAGPGLLACAAQPLALRGGDRGG